MFTPNQAEVRTLFCQTYAKWRERMPLVGMELIAARWIELHPEYFDHLSDLEAALAADYRVENGQTNPFLHLSMHLALEEQISIDQPKGIAQAYALLAARTRDAHAAHHEMMECLGEMIWASQRNGTPPDGLRYIECVRSRALK
jgi:hypothetical protein